LNSDDVNEDAAVEMLRAMQLEFIAGFALDIYHTHEDGDLDEFIDRVATNTGIDATELKDKVLEHILTS